MTKDDLLDCVEELEDKLNELEKELKGDLQVKVDKAYDAINELLDLLGEDE